MSILAALISKEGNRNENMIAEYNRELNTLPKGSIKVKKVKDRSYYYLSFRDGDKVITKYVGKDEETLNGIREQLLRRKQVEGILKKLKEENEQIRKLEALL
ncbi:MAG: hypothetical protein ACI35W_08160 [Anaeroplasmataceae bacterium]